MCGQLGQEPAVTCQATNSFSCEITSDRGAQGDLQELMPEIASTLGGCVMPLFGLIVLES